MSLTPVWTAGEGSGSQLELVAGCRTAFHLVQCTGMKGVTISPVNMKARAELGIHAGDIVRVSQKIQEKGKTRLQSFEGLVLAVKHHTEAGATFTVRKVSSGVGVERTFPLYSPMIEGLEIVRRSKVRRAKLYYVREKVAREAKRALRRMSSVNVSLGNGEEASADVPAEEAVTVGTEDKKE